MNRLSLAIKSESRWLWFLLFLAACQFAIAFAGVYAAALTSVVVGIVGYTLYRMWRWESKEFNPRMAFREFALQNAAVRSKPQVMNEAPSEIMAIFSQKAA